MRKTCIKITFRRLQRSQTQLTFIRVNFGFECSRLKGVLYVKTLFINKYYTFERTCDNYFCLFSSCFFFELLIIIQLLHFSSVKSVQYEEYLCVFKDFFMCLFNFRMHSTGKNQIVYYKININDVLKFKYRTLFCFNRKVRAVMVCKFT